MSFEFFQSHYYRILLNYDKHYKNFYNILQSLSQIGKAVTLKASSKITAANHLIGPTTSGKGENCANQTYQKHDTENYGEYNSNGCT